MSSRLAGGPVSDSPTTFSAPLIRKPLGEILVQRGLVNPAQLERALAVQRDRGGMLGRVLVDLGLISDYHLAEIVAEQSGFDYLELSEIIIDGEVVEMVPGEMARRYNVLPIDIRDGRLVVAMSDPMDVPALDELRIATGLEVHPCIASEGAIDRALVRHYGDENEFSRLCGVLGDEEEGEGTSAEGEEIAEAPVVKLVDVILTTALRRGASDIHLEPERDELRVRLRIDGTLHEIPSPPRRYRASLTSRIKIMAGIDISKASVPQDGRFEIELGRTRIGVRVSTFPTIYGENLVLRLLDRIGARRGLERLGLDEQDLQVLRAATGRPHGLILITGPTGSGKTATLYSILQAINSPDKNIATLEDPVEYPLPMIRQGQLNRKAGLTFASGLRAILRQDPDVIMVGEIRDDETAEIAAHAALTGHLVLSTLHSNDAASAPGRLIQIGVAPYLIATTLVAVVAQRLVRCVCSACAVDDPLSADAARELELDPGIRVRRGNGCGECDGAGTSGREGAFEVLPIDDDIRRLILRKADGSALAALAQTKGMRRLEDAVLAKALAGRVPLSEFLRLRLEHRMPEERRR